jgi:hypothetical protein
MMSLFFNDADGSPLRNAGMYHSDLVHCPVRFGSIIQGNTVGDWNSDARVYVGR